MLRSVILPVPEPLLQLLSDNTLSLADWYGEPLCVTQAEYWVGQLQSLSRHSPGPAQLRFRDRLAELVARYWSGRDAEMSYHSLAAVAHDDFECALLELCYGQLLLARKQKPARKHLDSGFSRAAHLLSASDYFRVMKRHQALAVLPLSGNAAEPSALDALLKEAAVIEKLIGPGPQREHPEGRHRDTLG
jgi:hypothetical protein